MLLQRPKEANNDLKEYLSFKILYKIFYYNNQKSLKIVIKHVYIYIFTLYINNY